MRTTRTSFLDSLPPLPAWIKHQKTPLFQLPAQQKNHDDTHLGSDLVANRGEHWLVLGMTGSGKTFFTNRLTRLMTETYHVPLYILDSKPAQEFDNDESVVISTDPPPLISTGRQIWRPQIHDLSLYGDWCQRILDRHEPCVVLINELSGITKGSVTPVTPPGYDRLMKQGRELGITMINETQGLSRIAQSAKEQATHIVQFRLNQSARYSWLVACDLLNRDSKTATNPRGKYGFFYRRIDALDDAREYDACQDFL